MPVFSKYKIKKYKKIMIASTSSKRSTDDCFSRPIKR